MLSKNRVLLSFSLSLIFSSCISLDVRKTYQRPFHENLVSKGGSEKILLLDVLGEISSSPPGLLGGTALTVQDIAARLNKAKKDKSIVAVLLRVDSPGGAVTASETIFDLIADYKKRSGKKIITYISNVAASGGYYIALAGDKIISHPSAIIGSVGAIFMKPNFEEISSKIGVDFQVYKSGIYKDMYSSFRKSSDQEARMIQGNVDLIGEKFQKHVFTNRQIKDENIKKQVASARIFLAEEALNLNLIDEVGSIEESLKDLHTLAGLKNKATVISYRRNEISNDTLYSQTPDVASSESNFSFFLSAIQNKIVRSGYYYLDLSL